MNKKKKILLVSNDINEETISELAAPIGLCYLASYVEKNLPGDFEFIIKSNLDQLPIEEADLVGISSMSRYFPRAAKLAAEIKARKNVPVILGGAHLNALPSSLPPVFDLGVTGEGEVTFTELLSLFKAEGGFPKKELEKIKGLVYHDEGKLKQTACRPLIENLDEIPFPKRDLWQNLGSGVMWISSSRGCPFNCVFCAVARTSHREFSAEYVAEELLYVKKTFNPPAISFHDDLFMMNQERLEQIIKTLRQKGFKRDTSFGLSLRANFITPESVKLLKELNVITVFIGIESGCEATLNYLKGGNLKLEQVNNALKLLRENNIMVEASFIIGAPPETRENLLETYNFILDHYQKGEITFLLTNLITPYPGSRIWEYAKQRGLVSDDMDFSRLNMALTSFDPYNCLYLNEKIPLTEFVDYIDIFEDLHFAVNKPRYQMIKESFDEIYVKRRLDRDRLKRFKDENSIPGK